MPESLNKKKLVVDVGKAQKPDSRYNTTTDVRKTSKFSLFGLFTGRGKGAQLSTQEANRIAVTKLATPTYYMKDLQFNFKLTHDDAFSAGYKEHFHKSWIDLKFNAGLVQLKSHDKRVSNPILPPADSERLTVVFNLDETLVSCRKDVTGDAEITISYKGKEINVS